MLKNILKFIFSSDVLDCSSCHKTLNVFDLRTRSGVNSCPFCQHPIELKEIHKKIDLNKVRNRRKKLKIERGSGFMLIQVPNSKIYIVLNVTYILMFAAFLSDFLFAHGPISPSQFILSMGLIALFVTTRPWKIILNRNGIEVKRLFYFTKKVSWKETLGVETPDKHRDNVLKRSYIVAQSKRKKRRLLRTLSLHLNAAVVEEIAEFKTENNL